MNAINESAIKKLQLLITVVDRQKAEFYQDVLSQYEINCQMILSGKGTAQSEIVDILGLNIHKAVLFSIVREDNAASAIEPALERRIRLSSSSLFCDSILFCSSCCFIIDSNKLIKQAIKCLLINKISLI